MTRWITRTNLSVEAITQFTVYDRSPDQVIKYDNESLVIL